MILSLFLNVITSLSVLLLAAAVLVLCCYIIYVRYCHFDYIINELELLT